MNMFGFSEFFVYIIIALILTRVPVVGKYFRLLNTLIHEIGHALMALVTSGRVYKVQVFSDTSGVAYTGSGNWFGRVLTSLAGYPFASFVAFMFVVLVNMGHLNIVVYMIVGTLVVSLLFWVRNWFGFVWVAVFSGCTVWLYVYASTELMTMYIYVVIAVLLIESVMTAVTILRLSLASPEDSGDCYNLSNNTKIPASFWGVVFLGQALYFFSLSYQYWV